MYIHRGLCNCIKTPAFKIVFRGRKQTLHAASSNAMLRLNDLVPRCPFCSVSVPLPHLSVHRSVTSSGPISPRPVVSSSWLVRRAPIRLQQTTASDRGRAGQWACPEQAWVRHMASQRANLRDSACASNVHELHCATLHTFGCLTSIFACEMRYWLGK